eukprot:3422470-Pyramimonas_sp.AAC.1
MPTNSKREDVRSIQRILDRIWDHRGNLTATDQLGDATSETYPHLIGPYTSIARQVERVPSMPSAAHAIPKKQASCQWNTISRLSLPILE